MATYCFWSCFGNLNKWSLFKMLSWRPVSILTMLLLLSNIIAQLNIENKTWKKLQNLEKRNKELKERRERRRGATGGEWRLLDHRPWFYFVFVLEFLWWLKLSLIVFKFQWKLELKISFTGRKKIRRNKNTGVTGVDGNLNEIGDEGPNEGV